jgi:hypothetical protein
LNAVAQLAHRRLDHAHVAARLDVVEQFEGIFNDVDHEVGVVTASLILNQLFDSPP